MSFIYKVNIILITIIYYLTSSIFSSNIIQFAKILMPILLIIIWFFQIILTNKKIKKIPSYILILFSFFFIFAFISVFMSEDIFLSISEILGLVSLFILSFYIVPQYIDTEEKYISFLSTLNWTLFGLLVIGIIVGYGDTSQTFTNFGNRIRYKSILGNANSLGSYTMLGCICSMALIYLKRKKKYIIPLIVNFIVLILTDSRTSILSTIIFCGIILFLYFYSKGRNIKILMRVLMFILFLLLLFSTIFLIYKLENISIQEINEMLSGRVDRWLNPFQEVNYKSLIFGMGSFSNYENPHNYFIKSILSWGIISTSIFFLVILLIYFNMLKKIKNSKNKIYLNITIALFISFLGFSFVESMFFNIGNLASIFLWSNLGISINGLDN